MDSDKKGRNMMLSRRFKRLLDGLLSRRAAGAGGGSLAIGLLARRSLGLRRPGCRLAGHYRLRPVGFLWLVVGRGFGRPLRNRGAGGSSTPACPPPPLRPAGATRPR